MAKARRSSRGRKRKAAGAKPKSPGSKQRNKKSKPTWNDHTSDSDTSPFKGYDENQSAAMLERFNVGGEDKDDVFDRLLDDGERGRSFYKNIRTYMNKNKAKHVQESRLLEFHDCKNRDDILQWLNNTQNVFDRLTQTQEFSNNCVYDDVLTLDMTSVSQRDGRSKVKKSHIQYQQVDKRPYKLRARSLDIQIKKNGSRGRNERHSLAGDTPLLDNYHIEELTDEDIPIPAEKEVAIVDLMEDEYLNNLEKEMLRHEERKHQGWGRIKDISRSLNDKRQPKKLKIFVKPSPEKKDTNLLNNSDKTYDYDVLENYFIENMERVMNQSIEESHEQNIKNIVPVFENLLETVGDDEFFKQYGFFYERLKNKFEKRTHPRECSTQTAAIDNVDESIQTEVNNIDVSIQTATNALHKNLQTDTVLFCQNCTNNNNNNNNITVNYSNCDKNIQTDIDLVNVGVQTDVTTQINQQISPSSSTTPDIFIDEKDKQHICEAFNNDFDIENNNNNTDDDKMRVKSAHDVFDDNFLFTMNTEELLEKETEASKAVNAVEKKSIKEEETQDSVLIVSKDSTVGRNKGVKRMQSDLSEARVSLSKRPCAKFIRDDLSVAFSTCAEDEQSQRLQQKTRRRSEDSQDLTHDEYLKKLNKKYNNQEERKESNSASKSRTQEQIEELENVIYNATKPRRSSPTEKDVKRAGFIERDHSLSPQKEFETLHTIRSSISSKSTYSDYFNTDLPEAEATPKKIRRNLFDNIETSPPSFSESMFVDDQRNHTVVLNRTITRDNVDRIMKEINFSELENDNDKEVQEIFGSNTTKIKILENVIVKRADDQFVSFDADVVESTPQKRRPSFHEGREESVLDITLPPPLEFQDMETPAPKSGESSTVPHSPRRPLAVINKITSTPISLRYDSEKISLSPISFQGRALPKPLPKHVRESSPNQENGRNSEAQPPRKTPNRVLGPTELAQQSKFTPLTIIKRPLSQNIARPVATPKQKSILNYVKSQESPRFEAPDDSFQRKPCIACSRISRDQVVAISSMTNKKLASYSTSFSPKVSHLIVSVNEKNCLKDHTIKFVSAVAAGIWVLNFDWVRECLRKNALVSEEPYEVLDVSGLPGPQTSRLTRTTNPLFKGYKVYAAPPFISTSQQEVENVVRLLGGKVVSAPEALLDKNGYVCVIVTEARATQDFELYETWLEALKVVTVDIEWISRSVGQYRLLSLRPFTLCSDDVLDNLEYPPELTVNMTYSFSQQTFSTVPSTT